ncbi:PRA1 family protein 3-like [Festucalex cinctus]
MANVELPPLRPWGDFFPGRVRFAKPDRKDMVKLNNRVVSNLLYYQTNYLVVTIGVFFIVGLTHPLGMFTAVAVVSGVFLCSVWAGDDGSIIGNFKRQNPVSFVIVVLVVSGVLISFLRSVMVFMTAITLPITLILAHSSCRLRNMKNKLENKIEFAGLKRSPMGIILECLGQQEENIQRIHNLLESK